MSENTTIPRLPSVADDGRLHVDVEFMEWLCDMRAMINHGPLESIVFHKGDVPLDIPAVRIKWFQGTGLSNADFIRTGAYTGEFEELRHE